MSFSQAYSHMSTVLDVHRVMYKDVITGDVCFALSFNPKNSTIPAPAKVLPPIVIDPAKIGTSSICETGNDALGQMHIFYAVPSLSMVTAAITGAKLDKAIKTSKLLEQTQKHASKDNGKSSREKMIKLGFNDSSQAACERVSVHCIHRKHIPNYKLKSLQFSYPSRSAVTTDAAKVAKQLAKCIENILKQCFCEQFGNTDLFYQEEKLVYQWAKSQHHYTKNFPKITNLGHSMVVIAMSQTSQTHLDSQNSQMNFGGHPDYHMCLTDNPNIAFLVYLPVGKNYILPLLVQQRKWATTFFYGGSFQHGSVHIGSYLNEYCKLSGNILTHMDFPLQPEWWQPIRTQTQRFFLATYTRSSLPMIYKTLQAYQAINQEPKLFQPKRGNGEGQMKFDRHNQAIRISKYELTAEYLSQLKYDTKSIS